MVDEQRSLACLETDVDRNVVPYEKFDFRVIAEQDIFGVKNRFMWRAARPDVPRGEAVYVRSSRPVVRSRRAIDNEPVELRPGFAILYSRGSEPIGFRVNSRN
jgi:hypothetical protein